MTNDRNRCRTGGRSDRSRQPPAKQWKCFLADLEVASSTTVPDPSLCRWQGFISLTFLFTIIVIPSAPSVAAYILCRSTYHSTLLPNHSLRGKPRPDQDQVLQASVKVKATKIGRLTIALFVMFGARILQNLRTHDSTSYRGIFRRIFRRTGDHIALYRDGIGTRYVVVAGKELGPE